jgi:hypothetical protein
MPILTIPVEKKDVFRHICTIIPADSWDEIKSKYHETRNHKIENFTPVIFEDKELLDEGKIAELTMILKEGRKYKKIAVIQCENEGTFNGFWNRLDENDKFTIGFNCNFIE